MRELCDLSRKKKVDATGAVNILVTGYSCRCQVSRKTDLKRTILRLYLHSSQKRQHVFDVIGEGGCGGVLGALACDDFQAEFG